VIDTFDDTVHSWLQHFHWPAEHVARLLLACVAGGLVGLERELRGRQAGFRTNLLVCVGSALVMIVSISFVDHKWTGQANVNLNIDPARIAYGITTGIGFLGAGTIIKTGSSVRGLTTAAGMWCVSAVGMTAGFGLYTLTLISTLLIVAALWILDYVERFIPKMHYRTMVVRRRWKPGVIPETIERIKAANLKVLDATFERRDEDLDHARISVRIGFIVRRKYYELERRIEEDPDYQLLAAREE
jgi:putative Mg2+ transporter-C (MgtC) family protein